MSKTLIFTFLLILISCKGTRNISFEKARHLSFKKSYKVFLNNSEQIDLKTRYLDVDNISKITSDKNLKTVEIIQVNGDVKLFKLSEINLEEFPGLNNEDFSMVILNGILIKNNKYAEYKIDYNSIKITEIVKGASASTFDDQSSGALIIITNENNAKKNR